MRVRTRSGFTLGPLAVSWGAASPGRSIMSDAQTICAGLLFKGVSIRLAPWRRYLAPWGREYNAGPALVLAWRL